MTSVRANKLYVLIGLPGANRGSFDTDMNYPVVSWHSVTEAIHGTPDNTANKALVLAHVLIMIKALFSAGHKDVVYDGPALTVKDRDQLKSNRWVRNFIYTDVNKQSCIDAAIRANASYLIPLIAAKEKEYVPVSTDEYTVLELKVSKHIRGATHDH